MYQFTPEQFIAPHNSEGKKCFPYNL